MRLAPISELLIVHRAGDVRKDIVGIGSDKPDRTHHDNQFTASMTAYSAMSVLLHRAKDDGENYSLLSSHLTGYADVVL